MKKRPSHISMFGKTKSKAIVIQNDLAAKLFAGNVPEKPAEEDKETPKNKKELSKGAS